MGDPQTHTMAASLPSADHSLPFSQPVCQNCQTSTTPLWRRDEAGSVLCNACGLFLKLHGRPRPISLKTDVIKSRNRVKSSGAAQGVKKKNPFDTNGLDQARSQAGTPPPGSMGHRRTSQKSANGHSDGSNSPISRTGTPSMYANHLPPFSISPTDAPTPAIAWTLHLPIEWQPWSRSAPNIRATYRLEFIAQNPRQRARGHQRAVSRKGRPA